MLYVPLTLQIHGAIFVVDAADQARLETVKEVFGTALQCEGLRGKPILMCGPASTPLTR